MLLEAGLTSFVTKLPVSVPPAKGNFVLSLADTPVMFEPSPYKVSKYPLATLTLLVPISTVLSSPGTKSPLSFIIHLLLPALALNII